MNDFQIINAPNTLRKAKLGSGPAKLDPALLERAEKAVAQMAVSYADWVKVELEELDATVKRLFAASGGDSASVKELYRLAFDMKGQGGSFGYPLLTRIAGSLADFLTGRDTLEGFGLEVAVSHVSAIGAVIAQDVRDDGGDTGAELIEGLDKLVRKAREEEANRKQSGQEQGS